MYPIMLNLEGRPVLVVGGGGVALRKVQGVLEEGAVVTVLDPAPVEPICALATAGQIILERRVYGDICASSFNLIFAATDDPAVNRHVIADAAAAGVWANAVDDPELCSFHVPSRVRRGPLQLAMASGGHVPFAVRRLRQLFDRKLGSEWAEWVPAASRFRDAVRALGVSRQEEEARYDRFFSSTVDPDRLVARVPTAAEEARWLEAPAGDHRTPLRRPGGSGREDVSATGLGLVSLVGAGPGCPGLLTLRGRQRLLQADAVVYDRLAAPALPCELDAKIELHPVGKVAGNHPVPQEEINALLVRLSREGRRVVRLKGGDPYVFGRGGEEAEVLAAEGVPFEVIPGVTSGVAAAAWMGIPVTHRREAVRLTLLTAHEALKSEGSQVRWELLAQDPHATIVGYMGVTALPEVAQRLLGAGMDPSTPAAMVQHGTTSAQRQVVSTLEHLHRDVVDAGIRPPALFIIGPTVRHADHLNWFSRRPLAGHRLVVACSSGMLSEALEAAGADVVGLPVPVTPAARVVMGALPLTGCVLRSSAEVDAVHEELGGPGWEDGVVAWCIGAAAAARARSCGWPDVVEIDGSELDAGAVVQRIVHTIAAMEESGE